MTRRSRIYVRSRLNVLTKFVKRQHGDFSFFFFFCIQKISFKNIGTVKGFIWDLQYGVYSKVKLINFVSRRIFNFPAEIQFRYSIAVDNNNNNDSEIINSSRHRLIGLVITVIMRYKCSLDNFAKNLASWRNRYRSQLKAQAKSIN